MSDKTFLRITNQMIYEEIKTLGKQLGRLSGTSKWHTWAIGILVLLITAIISRIM